MDAMPAVYAIFFGLEELLFCSFLATFAANGHLALYTTLWRQSPELMPLSWLVWDSAFVATQRGRFAMRLPTWICLLLCHSVCWSMTAHTLYMSWMLDYTICHWDFHSVWWVLCSRHQCLGHKTGLCSACSVSKFGLYVYPYHGIFIPPIRRYWYTNYMQNPMVGGWPQPQ